LIPSNPPQLSQPPLRLLVHPISPIYHPHQFSTMRPPRSLSARTTSTGSLKGEHHTPAHSHSSRAEPLSTPYRHLDDFLPSNARQAPTPLPTLPPPTLSSSCAESAIVGCDSSLFGRRCRRRRGGEDGRNRERAFTDQRLLAEKVMPQLCGWLWSREWRREAVDVGVGGGIRPLPRHSACSGRVRIRCEASTAYAEDGLSPPSASCTAVTDSSNAFPPHHSLANRPFRTGPSQFPANRNQPQTPRSADYDNRGA
jgi:hypothetical protein